MNLYLDDDSVKTKLVALLQRAGHRATAPDIRSWARKARDFESLLLARVNYNPCDGDNLRRLAFPTILLCLLRDSGPRLNGSNFRDLS